MIDSYAAYQIRRMFEVERQRTDRQLAEDIAMLERDTNTGDEQWRPVTEFPDHYEVSSWGRIRRISSGRILKPFKHQGRDAVQLFVNSVGHHRRVNALKKKAFPLG